MSRTLLTAVLDRARLAAVVALALAVGAGGALAAAAPSPTEPATVQTSTPQPEVTVPAPERVVVQVDVVDVADCPAGLRNHGHHVSGVARSVKPGPGHGKAVSAAARSDCGKPKEPEQGQKPEKADKPGRGHEREGHPGRGPRP